MYPCITLYAEWNTLRGYVVEITNTKYMPLYSRGEHEEKQQSLRMITMLVDLIGVDFDSTRAANTVANR